jgi:hypothetical protein
LDICRKLAMKLFMTQMHLHQHLPSPRGRGTRSRRK